MKKIYALLIAGTLLFSCSDDNHNDHDIFNINWPSTEFFKFGSSIDFNVIRPGHGNLNIEAPKGWTVQESNGKISITAPSAEGTGIETSGEIRVTANGKIPPQTMYVNSGFIVDFESAGDKYLAVDEEGNNLYSFYGAEQYTGYTDPESGLRLYLNDYDNNGDGSVITQEFWSGGTALSTWNIMHLDGYEASMFGNQCSVFYEDEETGKGGHNGSEVFAVTNGRDNEWGGIGPSIEFENGEEYVIDHIWVTNSTYAAIAMMEGYKYANELTYEDKDYFRVTFEGYDKNNVKKGSVTFYLADFRTKNAPGILKSWKKVELSALGKINRLKFVMEGTDEGDFGLNTPAYFCFDDVAIRR